MPIVQPPKPRHKFEDLGDTLRFTIPSQRRWYEILFISIAVLWATVWVMVAGAGIASLATSVITRQIEPPEDGFLYGTLTIFSCFMSVFAVGAFALWFLSLFSLAWLLIGREIIEVRNDTLKRWWQIFIPIQPKEYAIGQVSDLRVIPTLPRHRRYRRIGFWRMGLGPIAFEHGAKTIYLANEIDEAEAKDVLRIIQQRFPNVSHMGAPLARIGETVQHSTQQYRIEESEHTLKITIPNHRRWFLIAYMWFCIVLTLLITIPLGFVAYQELMGRAMSDGEPKTSAVAVGFLWFTALFWLRELHWLLKGGDIVEVSDRSITLRRQAVLPGSPSEHLFEHIKDLRVSSNIPKQRNLFHVFEGNDFLYYWKGWDTGAIAFDYGAKTIRFGDTIDDTEARQIVALIHQRFPQYR